MQLQAYKETMKKQLFLISLLSVSLASTMEIVQQGHKGAQASSEGRVPTLQQLIVKNIAQSLKDTIDDTDLRSPEKIVETLAYGQAIADRVNILENSLLKAGLLEALLNHFPSVKGMLTKFVLAEAIPWPVDIAGKLQFNPKNDNQLASISWESGQIRVITRNSHNILEIPRDHLPAATYTADGRHIASGQEANINLYNPATGELVRTLQGHNGFVAKLASNPIDNTLIAGILGSNAMDNTITIWNLLEGKQLKSFVTHNIPYHNYRIACNHTGTEMAESDYEQLRFWNLNTGTTETRYLPSIQLMAYAPNGNIAVSIPSCFGSAGSSDIRLLHSATQGYLKSYTIKETVTDLSYNPDPDTNQLAVSMYGGPTYVIDPAIHETLEQGQIIAQNSPGSRNAYNAQGTLLALTQRDSLEIYKKTEILPIEEKTIPHILFLALTSRLQKGGAKASCNGIKYPMIAILSNELSKHENLRAIISQKWTPES